MSYEQLYALLRLLTGKRDEELDRIPIEDLEQAADRAEAAARKWLLLRGFLDGSKGD